jgi:hypothetical protein
MHKVRRECLVAMLDSCLRSERAFVTGIGRNIKSAAKEKNNIKRADRLLSNSKLQAELLPIYCALSRMILSELKEVAILVDWSNIDKGKKNYLLRATVALSGRCLTIYEEVHPLEAKEKPATHRAFLKKLSEVLPAGVIPIIVTDAGFRSPWFIEVEKLGWHWLGRIRGTVKVREETDTTWTESRGLYSQATSQPKRCKSSRIGQGKDFSCHLYLYKAKPKGRKLLNKSGKPRKEIRSHQAQQRATDPWLIASSLDIPPKKAVEIYAYRMQIEESFRDTKSESYGIGLKASRTVKTHRLQVLVLLTTLANSFAWFLGCAVETQKRHLDFQANTITSYRILSFVFLGIKAFKKHHWSIPYQHFLDAFAVPKTFILGTFYA